MIIYVWNVMMDAYLYVEFIRPVIYSPALIGGNLGGSASLQQLSMHRTTVSEFGSKKKAT